MSKTSNPMVFNPQRIIGIDLSKKTFKACILTSAKNYEDRKIEPGEMKPEGRQKFISKLTQDDLVVMEGGTSSYNFAREIVASNTAEVVVLNPGRLHIIFQSQCKTDKQDCVKLAYYIRDTKRSSWCSLPLPTDRESELRSLVNSYNFMKAERTRCINNLHAIFNQNGIPFLKKHDLSTADKRVENMTKYLNSFALDEALLLENLIETIEASIETYLQYMREAVKENEDIALPWLSLPGIGLIGAVTLLAYTWDCSRFNKPKELRNYVGIVPRVDQSGDHNYVGGISSYGCKPIRKCLVQGALTIEKLSGDCSLKEFCLEKKKQYKKRQVVGIIMANKLLTIGLALQKNGTLYNGFEDGNERLRRKLLMNNLDIDLNAYLERHTQANTPRI